MFYYYTYHFPLGLKIFIKTILVSPYVPGSVRKTSMGTEWFDAVQYVMSWVTATSALYSHICPLQPLERKITPTWSIVPNSTSGHATLHLQASRYLQEKLPNSSARQVKAFIFQGRLPSRMHLPPSASAVWKCSKAGRISASLLSP